MNAIDVIVPVLGRDPRPFLDHFAANTLGAARPLLVANDEDEIVIEAIADRPEDVLFVDDPRFPPKAQVGYESTSAPWLALWGDDCRPAYGWDQRFVEAAISENVVLVSPNDTVTAAVMGGEHAQHPIMRRSWVDECGATLEATGGLVAHQGYQHNFCDHEWTARAKEDLGFAYAPHIVVVHAHPFFGFGEDDEIYRLGKESWDADQVLWRERFTTLAQPRIEKLIGNRS